MEEVKGFNHQTLYCDENYIRGYLYKTAQKLSLLQKEYFFRRYFVLDKR